VRMCGFIPSGGTAGAPATRRTFPDVHANIRSNRFIVVCSVPVRLIALALFTRMSMPPNFSAAFAAAAASCPRTGCRPEAAGPFPPPVRSPGRR